MTARASLVLLLLVGCRTQPAPATATTEAPSPVDAVDGGSAQQGLPAADDGASATRGEPATPAAPDGQPEPPVHVQIEGEAKVTCYVPEREPPGEALFVALVEHSAGALLERCGEAFDVSADRPMSVIVEIRAGASVMQARAFRGDLADLASQCGAGALDGLDLGVRFPETVRASVRIAADGSVRALFGGARGRDTRNLRTRR